MTTNTHYYGLVHGHQLTTATMISPKLKATVSSFGASLIDLVTKVGTRNRHIILHLTKPFDYLKERTFLGATVGRVAGRLVGHVWRQNDHYVSLPANEGPNHLHGGNEGLDQQWFNLHTRSSSNYDEVQLETVDFSGHNSYPGTMRIKVTYRLSDNELSMQISAITDAPTLFNPTNHTYFALDGNSKTIDNDTLKLKAHYFQPLKKGHLPVGSPSPVANTVFDLNNFTKLSDILNCHDPQIILENGLNHPFLLTQQTPAATLVSGDNRVKLDVSTDASSLILYSANHFDGTGVCKQIPRYGGITFEAQEPPVDDVNWSSITLLPGEQFIRTIKWHIISK